METKTFLALLFTIAASMFGHGLVKLPKLASFSSWMVGSFEKSMLPQVIVVPLVMCFLLLNF